MFRTIIFFFCFIALTTFSGCELVALLKKETMDGTWKVHYRYDGEEEVLMPVTFLSDHQFTFPVDEKNSSGVWTLKDNNLELEFSDRMVWKGVLNEDKNQIKNGVMLNSGIGNGGGSWDGKKIDY